MSRPVRLTGPRVTLVVAPHAVAVAVSSGGDVPRALASCGRTSAPDWPHPDSADALRPFAEHGGADAVGDTWLVLDEDDRVVGECGATGPVDDRGEQEIGYGLARSARGRGLATEAVAVLCAWLERQDDVRRLAAEVTVGNVASQALLLRLGFVRGPASPPYERWVRGEREPLLRRAPGPVSGRHVC